jgi:hypothetical protein
MRQYMNHTSILVADSHSMIGLSTQSLHTNTEKDRFRIYYIL